MKSTISYPEGKEKFPFFYGYSLKFSELLSLVCVPCPVIISIWNETMTLLCH